MDFNKEKLDNFHLYPCKYIFKRYTMKIHRNLKQMTYFSQWPFIFTFKAEFSGWEKEEFYKWVKHVIFHTLSRKFSTSGQRIDLIVWCHFSSKHLIVGLQSKSGLLFLLFLFRTYLRQWYWCYLLTNEFGNKTKIRFLSHLMCLPTILHI